MAHALLWYKLNVSLKFPEMMYWGSRVLTSELVHWLHGANSCFRI